MSIKITSQQRFYTKIHKTAKEKQIPLRVMFELTYRCNFHCRHCYVPDSYRRASEKKDLSTKDVFIILDQLKEIGCFYLGFTGGEPFMRQDIMDILWRAKGKGFEIIIYTNGSLIDQKTADELKRLKPNKIDITLHSIKSAPFERIAQTPGSHKKVFDAIKLLRQRSIPLGFKGCLVKENAGEIEDIRRFSDSCGTMFRLDTMLEPRLDGSKEPYVYRVQRTENREQKGDAKCSPPALVNPLRARKLEKLFKCGVGQMQAAITPFGELKMCVDIDYPKYKILQSSLQDCWQRLKELAGDITPDEKYKCNGCDLEPYCNWCPARSFYIDGGFTSCDPDYKRKAEYIRNISEAQ